MRNSIRSIIVVVVVSFFFFYEFGLNNIFNVLREPISHAFGLNAVMSGFVASLYLYTNLMFLFLAGALLDRFSPRRLIVLAMFICSTGTWLVAVAPSLSVLMLARLLMGVGGGFCMVGCIRIAVNWLPSQQIATAAGFIVTMGMLGGYMVQAPFAKLVNFVGWREGLWVVAFVGYAITLVIFAVVRDRPKATEAKDALQTQSHSMLAGFKQIFTRRQSWACAVYAGCINIPIAILGAAWGVAYLTHVYGVSALAGASITGMLFIGTMVGGPIMGWLSDFIGRRKPMMLFGILASMVLFGLIVLLPHPHTLTLYVLYFLLGMSTSAQVVSYPTLSESHPLKYTGTATSIISMMCVLGGIISQPLFGWLVQVGWGGHSHPSGAPAYSASQYAHAIYLVLVFFVLSLVMALLVKETYCVRKELARL